MRFSAVILAGGKGERFKSSISKQLILGATKPFRTGANILAQNWGSALSGKDMSQEENQAF